ncbi:MAG: hypothetical protein JSW12_18280 [Deltaproteobacteria bacterium]|nr:MAG: hypothetical protein JSW12_18280 [Deltaproteobacteria bacterium]
MPRFPKLKVTHWVDGQPSREILDFEQAPYFLFNYDVLVAVEGEVMRSYEELVQLASQDRYKDRDFLEVRVETIIGGG